MDLSERQSGESPCPADFVSDLVFTLDGGMLVASVGEDLLLYDPNRGRLRHTLMNALSSDVSVSMLTAAGREKVIAGGVNGCVGVFDVRAFKKPVNIFKAHPQQICNITYVPEQEWIISSDPSGQVMYWFLPAVSVEGQLPSQAYHGPLFTCPSLNHICISSFAKTLVVSSSVSSYLFLVKNLDMVHLQDNMHDIILNDGLQMHLAFAPSLAAKHKHNRIQVLSLEEFSPILGAKVSPVSHMEFLPSSSVLLLRCTTTQHNLPGVERKDWMCVGMAGISQSEGQYDDILGLRNYGSDIFAEFLVFSIEEPRYANLREKKFGISNCGRVIASPNKKGVRLLSLSSELNDIHEIMEKRKKLSFEQELFWPNGPSSLHTVKLIPAENPPLCCLFSPNDILLATGDNLGNISFHHPAL